MTTFIYGLIGFLGFEALRVYKRLWARLPVSPSSKKWLYIAVLLALAAFSGFTAEALANGNKISAIFTGFSVPTGLKALLERPTDGSPIPVDDVELHSTTDQTGLLARIRHGMCWLRNVV